MRAIYFRFHIFRYQYCGSLEILESIKIYGNLFTWKSNIMRAITMECHFVDFHCCSIFCTSFRKWKIGTTATIKITIYEVNMSELFPPKQNKQVNRTKQSTITIRTTEQTANAFKELKEKTGLNYDQLIEKIIEDGYGLVVEINSQSLKTVYENFEKKIAEPYNNLNQIAKHLNSSENIPDNLWKTLETIDKMFNTLNGYLRDQKRYVKVEKKLNDKE